MLDGLAALHLGHRQTKAQFETDVGAEAAVRRAKRGHRSRVRMAAAVAVHSLTRPTRRTRNAIEQLDTH